LSVDYNGGGIKDPGAAVLIIGNPDDKCLERLTTLYRVYGPRGIKLIVISNSGVSRVLESMRSFLQKNTSFTIELYVVNPGDATRSGVDKYTDVVTCDQELLEALPSNLKSKVVAQ